MLLALLDVTERVQSDQALAEANAGLETRVKERTAEVQRYAERLAASNKELENFAMVASHDLQEPLRKIESFGKRLRERLADKLETSDRNYLERMLSAVQRMRGMIDGLLSLSRVATKAVRHQTVDMGKIAMQVVEDLEVRIRQCQAQMLLGPLPSVQADPLQMEQLLMNLISNGLKFHREGVPPQVKLYGRLLPDGQAEIVIEDNGIGIEAQYIPRLFQPFQRLHERGRYDGSGMGLAICRKIVERHGGSIALSSQPGQGSQFIIKLKAEN
jgi:light-regulated signal transduction histidine kinase (bacteriophytochrome)